MDDENWKLDDYSLRPLSAPSHYGIEEVSNHDYSLAVTGDVFRWMINYAPLETLQRVSGILCFKCAFTELSLTCRCWSRRRFSLGCHLTRSMSLSNAFKPSGTQSRSVAMAQTTVVLSRLPTSDCRCRKRRHLLRLRSLAGRQILGA